MKENDTKTQKKGAAGVIKAVVNAIINIMIVLVLIVSVTIAIMALSSKSNGVSVIFGHTIENVQTDSMKGGSEDFDGGDFEEGDIIIGKYMGNSMLNEEVFKPGDIITYRGDLDGDIETKEYICHRIIEVSEYQGTAVYRTKGDNNPVADQPSGEYATYLNNGDITSVFYSNDYQGTIIKGFGKVLSFLQSKFGFFICILVPMIIFFLYELIRVIFNYAYFKKAKVDEENEAAEAQKQAEIEAAVAEAMKAKSDSTAETPELTPEQMEEFKQFLEAKKQKDQQKNNS